LLALPLSGREIQWLKMSFLVKLQEITRNSINKSVEKTKVFDGITSAYNKDLVMPYIVQALMDDGLIVLGNNENEVRLNTKTAAAKRGIHLLKFLNDLVNTHENITIGVTLNIKGLIVSGKLVGLKIYYRGVSQMLQEENKENSKLWASLFDGLIETLPKEEEYDIVRDIIGIRHICLQDARYYPADNSLPTDMGTYWIGLTESVDGFSFGTFG
jgi:hypothetical protein